MLKFTKLLQDRDCENLEVDSRSSCIKLLFNWKKRCLLTFTALIFMTTILPILVNPGSEASVSYYESNGPTLIGYHDLDTLDKALEREIRNYIISNSFGSKLNTKKFIKSCFEENFDIILALSQAHIESHFGTRGKAARTNSVFNVGTYDNGVVLYRYDSPDLSVIPYISLMKRHYLLNNKTSKDLLKPYSFVNYRGNRYASLKYYEYRVEKVYNDISENTPIKELWDFYISDDVIYSREFWNSVNHLYSLIIH